MAGVRRGELKDAFRARGGGSDSSVSLQKVNGGAANHRAGGIGDYAADRGGGGFGGSDRWGIHQRQKQKQVPQETDRSSVAWFRCVIRDERRWGFWLQHR